MTQDDVLALVRHLLTTLGGGLIAHGYVSSDQWSQIVGGIIALGVAGWSLYQKSQQRKAVAIALATPVPTQDPAFHSDTKGN